MEKIVTLKHLDPKAKTLFITPTMKLIQSQDGGMEPEGSSAGEWTMKQVTIDISTAK